MSVFLKNWDQSGIKNVSSLVDEHKKCFLSFQSFRQKFHLNCNFLQYYGILSAIPSSWKELLKLQTEELSSSTPTIESVTCRTIYHLLINRKNLPPPTADKKLVKCGFDPLQRRKVYSLPFVVTKEVKLSVFQVRVIHNILSTNSLIYKMKKKIDSPICPFCPDTEQSITHLFVHCSLAVSFWNEFTAWYRSLCKKHSAPVLTEYEILYGVLKGSSSLQTLNHLILMSKYFLFICAKNNKKNINLRILSFPCKNKWI